MNPSVSVARGWQPGALLQLAGEWDAAARRVRDRVDHAVADAERSADFWTGAAADAARSQAHRIGEDTTALARRLIAASAAAQDGATRIGAARDDVLAGVADAHRDGLDVADDGSVTLGAAPAPLLVLLAGGSPGAADKMLEVRAAELSARITAALSRLRAADVDAAADLRAALGDTDRPVRPAATVAAGATAPAGFPVGVDGWPSTGQDAISAQIAAMTDDQRTRLIAAFPREAGNTDGVPWDMRIAANRINIATAVLDETGADPASRRRIGFYRDLLGEIDDPSGGNPIPRKIVAFDPRSASLVELNGDLTTARSVAVLVPGVNTTIEGSARTTATARRFVSATAGDVAVLTFLGGPFPQVHDAFDVFDAADARYAEQMAPRLVAFTEDLDRRVAPGVPVTVIGHSYGGSIVGTAETLGLTSDRTVFLAAAGAGAGVDEAEDWHNRNPEVTRFSMTPPGDFIELVQGLPAGPHGADPDEVPGVIALRTGYYDDGTPVRGWDAHSGMLNRPSDSWRTILAIITGDTATVHRAVIGAHH